MLIAVVVPGTLLYYHCCFHCPEYYFLTSHFIKILFILQGLTLVSITLWKKLLTLSTELFPSLHSCHTWCVHLFSYFLHCLISIYTSVSPNGRSLWDYRQCYSFLYLWLMVYYLDMNRCSTSKYWIMVLNELISQTLHPPWCFSLN